jgi:predicted ATPase
MFLVCAVGENSGIGCLKPNFLLLMIGFTTAFLRPGGILLIDEPDLHIHLSMVSQFMETLEVIAGRRNAQMIVASHSEWVWERFSRDAERIELSPWRGGSE